MLARNALAHVTARGLSLAAGLVMLPLVAATLGSEALGLVGLQASFQVMLGLFDLGVPIAANKALAVHAGRGAPWRERAALVRSLEILLWALAAAFFVVGLALAKPLTLRWLNIEHLSSAEVERAIVLIVAGVAVRFPIAFYSNVGFGLARHVFPNAVVSLMALVRVAASVVALFWFRVDVIGFFVVQFLCGMVEVGALAIGIWRGQGGWRVRPRWSHLREIAGHSALLSGVSVTAVGLAQADKIVLSALLPLGAFGIYSAAYALASGLAALSYPIGNAIFPGLSQSLDRGDRAEAGMLVRWGSALTLLLVVPIGVAIAAQGRAATDLLFFLGRGAPGLDAVLPVMMLGGLAQAYVTVPQFFQIAANRSAVVLWVNVVFLPLYALATWMAAIRWGMAGGAAMFAAFGAARLLVHWGLLAGDARGIADWRRLPAITLAMTGGAFALAYPLGTLGASGGARAALLVATALLLTVLIVLLSPELRQRLRTRAPKLPRGTL